MGRSNLRSPVTTLNHGDRVPEKLEYRDKRQVELDISRLPISKAAAANLERRVGVVLVANKHLRYYQGFHDIAVHSHSTKQLENLALQQLRDFMAEDLKPTIQILKLVPELIVACDPNNMAQFFQGDPDSRRMSGYFALAPIVTLFSHDCQDTEVIGPIIRNVLKEGLPYLLYLYVALVIENGATLKQKLKDGGDEDELDMAFQGLAATLSRDNYAALDRRARQLRSRHKLRNLHSWSAVSRFSVLKTGKITKRSTALHTLGQLERSTRISGLRPFAVPTRTLFALAMGAVAVGMLWSRIRR